MCNFKHIDLDHNFVDRSTLACCPMWIIRRHSVSIPMQTLPVRSLKQGQVQYTLTCYSSLFVSSPPLLGRSVARQDKKGTRRGRQLLQWLTSKLKDSLRNRRYVSAFFRRARSGRGERDTRGTAGKMRLLRACLKNATDSACSAGY